VSVLTGLQLKRRLESDVFDERLIVSPMLELPSKSGVIVLPSMSGSDSNSR
jgi:hypothetical protein